MIVIDASISVCYEEIYYISFQAVSVYRDNYVSFVLVLDSLHMNAKK